MISVIVPVFNVEKYLRQCIRSVLAQTYSCLELILIDDASSDRSADICMEMARQDERIRYFRNESNLGQAESRNIGLNYATGALVTFLDSDDMLLPDSLRNLAEVMEATHAPIVCGSYRRFMNEPPAEFPQKKLKFRIIDRRKALKRLLYQKGQPDSSVWGKLYDINLFKEERFRPGIIYEDLDIVYRLISKTKEIAITGSCVYLYRRNPDSTLSVFNRRRLDVLDVTQRTVRFFESEEDPGRTGKKTALIKGARDRRLSAAFNILGLIYNSSTPLNAREQESKEQECKEIIRSLRFDSLIDPEVRLKNKIGILSTYIGGFRLYRYLSRFIYL